MPKDPGTRPRRFARLFRHTSRGAEDIRKDVQDEFTFHLDMRTAALEKEGLSRHDARAVAEREFGDRARGAAACARQDEHVEARRTLAMWREEITTDLRYAIRAAVASPWLSIVVIVTLAVAIAGNTAVFTIVNSLLLKPPAYDQPSRLVRIYTGESHMSWPNFEDISQRATVFDAVIAQRAVAPPIQIGESAVVLMGAEVSINYFTALAVPAQRGRTFLPSDTRSDIIVISDRLWRTRFSSDPAVIGRLVRLNGEAKEILGVMPAQFRGLTPPGLRRDFWTPISPTARPTISDRRERRYEAFARLTDGISLEAARSAIAVIGAALKQEYPDQNERFDATTLYGVQGFDGFRGIGSSALPIFAFVGLLAIAAGLVLLLACANIAGLLLGRATARRRETAVRLALGAGRARLIRQLLAESFVLAFCGAAGGVLLSVWLTGLAQHAAGDLPLPMDFDLSPDWRVLVYCGVLASATALLFGLSPARRAARTDLISALKNDDTTGHQRLRQALVVAQVFGCTVLLLWAALFTRSLGNVSKVDPGFRTEGVLVVDISPPDQIASSAQANEQFFDRLLERVAGIPGVTASGMAWTIPLGFMGRAEYDIQLADAPDQTLRRVMSNVVSPGYFRAIDVPLLAGRDFTAADRPGSPRAVLVNETAARAFWNGQAVGRRIRMPEDDKWVDATVVGVVRDSKYLTLGEQIQPTVYPSLAQGRQRGMNLFVRTTTPSETASALRSEIGQMTRGMPVEVQRFEDAIKLSLLPARVGAAATAVIGCTAMLLAVVGIYALVSFSVAQRYREIGIRRAVGASSGSIARLIVGGSLWRVGAGLLPGLVIGALGAAAFAGFIVGVSPFDLPTLASIAAVILLAATAASALPAYRASRVDPLQALRSS